MDITLLRLHRKQHHVDGHICNISGTGQRHDRHSIRRGMVTGLFRNVPWCHSTVRSEPNDSAHPQRWILPVGDGIPQSRWRTLFLGITQLQRQQRKQRRHSHHLWNNQKRNIGGFWSQMWSHRHQLQVRRPTTDNTWWNGTPTSAHPHTNRKFHHRSHHEFNHATKTVQSNGNALLLGAGSHKTKTVQRVLETRINKFWILSYKTPCAHSSS